MKNKHTKNIKKKVLGESIAYRIINVISVGLMLFFTIFSVVASADSFEPRIIANQYRSQLICNNGKSYTFKDANLGSWEVKDENSLNEYGDKTARVKCSNFDRQSAISSGYTDFQIDDYIESNLIDQKNYSLFLDYRTEGSWIKVILYSVLGSVLGYIVIGVLRLSLIYIIFGEKFTLKSLIPSFIKKDRE